MRFRLFRMTLLRSTISSPNEWFWMNYQLLTYSSKEAQSLQCCPHLPKQNPQYLQNNITMHAYTHPHIHMHTHTNTHTHTHTHKHKQAHTQTHTRKNTDIPTQTNIPPIHTHTHTHTGESVVELENKHETGRTCFHVYINQENNLAVEPYPSLASVPWAPLPRNRCRGRQSKQSDPTLGSLPREG